jgi:hypothetical protein
MIEVDKSKNSKPNWECFEISPCKIKYIYMLRIVRKIVLEDKLQLGSWQVCVLTPHYKL